MARTLKTPLGDAPILPLLLIIAGGYLAWFGIHYWRRDVRWPSDPIKAVLQGKPIPDPGGAPVSESAALTANVQAFSSGSGGSAAGGGGGAVQGTYDHAGLEQLWKANGGSSATANLAAAIAQAESSGQAGATSANPDGGTNVGLWQLDTKGVGAGYTVDQLKDPNTNARITIMATNNGTSWGPWATFHSGAYQKFMGPQNVGAAPTQTGA
jgi:hypothetical protein